MESALLIDAFVLAAVFEADLGRRKIGKFRIVRPLLMSAAIIPLYLQKVTTTGSGLTLELALGAAGILLGLIATALMTVYRNPSTGKPTSRAGWGYAALWAVIVGARAAFSYGSTHWFSHPLGTWMIQHSITVASLTDALIFMAIGMVLTRTIGLAARAHRVTTVGSDLPARHLQDA